ncbi:MAG TPA: hypothetical protein VFH99_00945 [Candidatus Saccharimonadales bacterium]|nr:hypothetical protein [Candidatus Saccharimonadales bacterium]
MYRLTLYYLIALVLAAAGLSLLGYLHFNPWFLLLSSLYLPALCWVASHIFAYVYDAPANHESSLITALILILIITPASTPHGILFITAAGGLAMASKYMLAWRKKHIFNPAAIAVVLTSIGAGQAASWWVGSGPMLAFVLIGGLLLARKVRRFQMIIIFVMVSYIATAIYVALGHGMGHGQILAALHKITFNSAVFFLAFVMLTEPQTSPARAREQRWCAALVGALFPPQVHLFSLYSTPEIALVTGNIFTWIFSPKTKVFPKLARKNRLAPNIVDFVFKPTAEFSYQPGQYMEWTLPHAKPDSRGDRRYFTLASSPTEPNIHLGIKFYPNGSSYKKAMLAMDNESDAAASRISGEFVMPLDSSRKLAFIAGGIGVTPYRSMLKYLIDRKERRDIVMLYAAKSAEEIVYQDVLEAARAKLGSRVTYCVGRHINTNLIQQQIPDYGERLFYISGPHGMVTATKHTLRELGVHNRNIKIDFFPGYS